MDTFFIPFLFFAAAAYFDYKAHKIPDILTAGLWLYAVLALPSNNAMLTGASFAGLFFLNSLIALAKKKFMGWGDVLIIPPFVGIMQAIEPSLFFALLAFAGWFLLMTRDKKEVPLAPFLFAGMSAGLLFRLISC